MDGGISNRERRIETERLKDASASWNMVGSIGLIIIIISVICIIVYLFGGFVFNNNWMKEQVTTFSPAYKGLVSGLAISVIGFIFSTMAEKNSKFVY
jgi:uncharacterized protein YneF (UPF0154 family)